MQLKVLYIVKKQNKERKETMSHKTGTEETLSSNCHESVMRKHQSKKKKKIRIAKL